jgi:rhamnogalacturonyl hydrolase YesR
MKRVDGFSGMKKYVVLLLWLGSVSAFSQVQDVRDLIRRVNDHWQATHPEPGNAFWHQAAYQIGNMAAYEAVGDEHYRAYAERWAEKNNWKGAASDDRSQWKYSYGEDDNSVLFGDWQACFQPYVDLYHLDPDERKIARAREVMEFQMATPNNDYWWWADGLFMGMPVMTKLYRATGNELYLQKLYAYFSYAKALMFDAEAGLFYRDAKYIYPKHQTRRGLKDFWARGNGWVFAALARVLADLPEDDAHRNEYVEVFRSMAKALKGSQQPEGHWSRSILDTEQAPGYESSGTAFFAFGFLWGINHHLLDGGEYEAVAERAWDYLVKTALQPDGTIGYVQPIGERADQHVVDRSITADFGVGAFLLAATEKIRYMEQSQAGAFYPGRIWKDNTGRHINAHGGGILYHEGRYYWFGEHKGEQSNSAHVGVTCYSSTNLYDWTYERVALAVEKDPRSEIVEGCIIERPKVIYNAKTKKFVMYFHLELKDKGYSAARTGIAVGDRAVGPYRYVKSVRPNAKRYPVNMNKEQKQSPVQPSDFTEQWTEEWKKAVGDGMFVRRDFAGGQMARDMTLYVDDDGKAYHIYASEENLTLQLAELSDDYLNYTGKYTRIAPAGHNEAPAIGKKDGKYFLITSGCTGWAPNAARLFTADNLWGPWSEHPNPCQGEDAGLTFHSQSTYILPVAGKRDAFIFMADRWVPSHPIDGRYVWLPVRFENDFPVLRWLDRWDLGIFDEGANDAEEGLADRKYWTDLAYKMAAPVLENMSKGRLSENMQLELSPTWDGRDKRVSYMEAFGRLMDGIAPWLALPDDDTEEGRQRKQLREWALKSYAHAVDPDSPDYLLWRNEGQPLVDAAYIASSFLRVPEQLWDPLDPLTKQRYITEFQQLRRVDPPYTNWLLFSATVETFLLSIDAQYDMYRIHSAIRKIEEWYVGDGWYSDGEHFAFDYYNSYVIHPMYVNVLKTLADRKMKMRDKSANFAQRQYEEGVKRMQRFGMILERLISPEGSFPVFGRSMTYRLGVFQPLALLAWKEQLPEELPEGQIRAALTAVMKQMFSIEENFNEKGFLQLGFAGHQPNLADWYTNNGSLYLMSEVFLPLGLPANHSFWTSPAQDWTAKKAWNGVEFPKDHATR